MTLFEKYYAINDRLNKFLQSRYSDLKILKFGIDVGTLRTNVKEIEKVYPYAISYLTGIEEKAWTSYETGIYTVFTYQLNFFTSPKTEFTNDSVLQKAFDLVRVGLTDINLKTLEGVADLKSLQTSEMNLSIVSGAIVPSRILIAKFSTVCSYPETLGIPTLATDTSQSTDFIIEE